MTGRIGLPDVQRDEGDNPPYVARHCYLCKRPLDVAGVPDSLDCGGDCWGCIREIEDPDLREMNAVMEEHEVMEVAAKYSRPEDPNADLVGLVIPSVGTVIGTPAWSDGMYVAVDLTTGGRTARLAGLVRAFTRSTTGSTLQES